MVIAYGWLYPRINEPTLGAVFFEIKPCKVSESEIFNCLFLKSMFSLWEAYSVINSVTYFLRITLSDSSVLSPLVIVSSRSVVKWLFVTPRITFLTHLGRTHYCSFSWIILDSCFLCCLFPLLRLPFVFSLLNDKLKPFLRYFTNAEGKQFMDNLYRTLPV